MRASGRSFLAWLQKDGPLFLVHEYASNPLLVMKRYQTPEILLIERKEHNSSSLLRFYFYEIVHLQGKETMIKRSVANILLLGERVKE